eukprot:scaffold21608_cov18-Tisochrysis_lutea.AAC.1
MQMPPQGPVPIDPKSLKMAEDAGEPETTQFLTNDAAMQLLKSSIPLRRVEKVNGTYSAVFIAGGHGAAFDLVEKRYAAGTGPNRGPAQLTA